MTKQRKILNIISLIRDSHNKMAEIYTKGSCLNFFLILHSIFPEATPYYNIDHVITEIDGKYYDITGQVFKTDAYRLFHEIYSQKRIRRSFSQMLNYELNISNEMLK